MNCTRENCAADDLRQRRHRQRLGQARDSLDQAMAVGQQAQQDAFDEPVLPDDDPLDLEEGILEQSGVFGAGHGVLLIRAVQYRAGSTVGSVGCGHGQLLRVSEGSGLRVLVAGHPVGPSVSVTLAACATPVWSVQRTVHACRRGACRRAPTSRRPA